MIQEEQVTTPSSDDEGLRKFLDPAYPLLNKLRNACPGTYKHSQTLASLVEGAAMALDLDVLKMQVAAQYHDIGKMFAPKYFIENQGNDDNPHDTLTPIVSYQIITRHVSDSVVILINDPAFPRSIIEIISQHHGTSVLQYFSDKAKDTDGFDYRYKTTKPSSIESAILMIADRVEATSKALAQEDKFSSVDIVEATINDLLNGGQLDAVYMKLGDLKIIKEVFSKEIEGTHQKRIDYSKKD